MRILSIFICITYIEIYNTYFYLFSNKKDYIKFYIKFNLTFCHYLEQL